MKLIREVEIAKRARGEGDSDSWRAVKAEAARIASTPDLGRDHATELERREAERYGYTLESWRAAKFLATVKAIWAPNQAAADAAGYTPETWIAATDTDRELAIAAYDSKQLEAAAVAAEEAERRCARLSSRADKAEAAEPATISDGGQGSEGLTFVEIAKRARGEGDSDSWRAVKAEAARIASTPDLGRDHATELERREAERYGYTLESWRAAKFLATVKAIWAPNQAAADAAGYTPETWIAATDTDRELAIAAYDAKQLEAAVVAAEEAERRRAEADAKAEAERQARMNVASRTMLTKAVRAGDGSSYELWFVAWAHVEGFEPMRTAGDGADFGVDVVVTEDGDKVAVQCKNYTRPVGVSAVQEVIAGMRVYGCTRGWVAATSAFTRQAQILAKANDVQLLTLVPDNYIRDTHSRDWNGAMADAREAADYQS